MNTIDQNVYAIFTIIPADGWSVGSMVGKSVGLNVGGGVVAWIGSAVGLIDGFSVGSIYLNNFIQNIK